MNYRLKIQYDGTRYNGWQRLPGATTIQGKIEEVLSRMEGCPVEIHGAGRTDAGVHAHEQIANVHLSKRAPDEIREYLNHYLPDDIGIMAVDVVSDRFHSRLNASNKVYIYRLATDSSLHVMERKFMTPWTTPLDVAAMRRAADLLVGEHDFQSFCSKKMKKTSVRTIYSIDLVESPGELTLRFEGNGFLYHMVRILTGTLLEVGSGKRDPESIPALLRACDRSQAGPLVPAQGLALKEVRYQ